MAANGDPEETPQPERIIANPQNREIVTILGNLVIEARQHTLGLRALYDMARDWSGVVPRAWGYKLIEEEERHVERSTAQLIALRAVVG